MPTRSKGVHVRSAVIREGRSIQYEVDYGPDIRPFFTKEPFFVEYDRDIGDVPEGVRMIPLLANVCPVAWFVGADVYVERLDRSFYESLLQVKEAFAALYPRIKLRGELHVGELTDDRPANEPGRTAAFFSGGVDSLGTFLRKREENPMFITIWGGDIRFDQPEFWERVRSYNESFAASNGIESLFVKSSLRSFLNEGMLSYYFGRFTHSWWPGVQHGIGMVGLCAPLAYALGIGRLYVPSALPPALAKSIPDGSNTTINNRLRWAGTKVALEGEELTRQDKVSLIADYIRESKQPLNVRVCWTNTEYGNCCRCEKCLRTAAALAAEGIDPRTAGFPVTDETFGWLKQQLPRWLPSYELRVEYWNEIRLRALANRERLRDEDRPFFNWLIRQNLLAYKHKTSLLRSLIERIPQPVFLLLKRKRKIS